MNRAEINELERVQYATEHATKILFLDVAQRQVEMEVAIVPNDMDPTKKKSFVKAQLQFLIKVSLKETEDDIVEICPRTAHVRPRPMFDANEQLLNIQWMLTNSDA